jgi:DNA-binding winged helix-turn-helix (wHTH) protein
MARRSAKRDYIAVIGTPAWLRGDHGIAEMLRQLGANVRTLDANADPLHLIDERDDELRIRPRAAVFEALEAAEQTIAARRALHRQLAFERIGTLLVVSERQLGRIDRASGFDDFVVTPCSTAELYARVEALSWRRARPEAEQTFRFGELLVDCSAREARVLDEPVTLTSKEFSLLVELCEHAGRALSRQGLLERVWGKSYSGGPRTVDIHVRRLRAKLGDALRLETLRRWGYRLRPPLPAEEEKPVRRRAARKRKPVRK